MVEAMREFCIFSICENGKVFIPTNPEVGIRVGDPEPFQILQNVRKVQYYKNISGLP